MTNTSDDEQAARRARHEAIRGEVAAEGAEAAEAEAAVNAAGTAEIEDIARRITREGLRASNG